MAVGRNARHVLAVKEELSPRGLINQVLARDIEDLHHALQLLCLILAWR